MHHSAALVSLATSVHVLTMKVPFSW